MYITLLLANHFSVLKFCTSLPFQAQTAFLYVRFDGRCWGHARMDKYTVMLSGSCSIMDKISWLLKSRAILVVLTTNLYRVSHRSSVKHNLYCKAAHTVFVCTSALFVRMYTCSDSLNPKCHSSCQSRWVFMAVMEHSGSCFQ